MPHTHGDVADGQEGTHLLESRFINRSASAARRGGFFFARLSPYMDLLIGLAGWTGFAGPISLCL